MGLIQYYQITCQHFNQAICIFIIMPIIFSNLVSIKCIIVLLCHHTGVIMRVSSCVCYCGSVIVPQSEIYRRGNVENDWNSSVVSRSSSKAIIGFPIISDYFHPLSQCWPSSEMPGILCFKIVVPINACAAQLSFNVFPSTNQYWHH